MGRKLIAFMLVLVMLTTCGCEADPVTDRGRKHKIIGEEISATIGESLMSKDAASIKALLIPSMQEDVEIDKQIEKFLNFIDDTIVNISEPRGGSSAEGYSMGKYRYQYISGYISHIITESGKDYTIHWRGTNIPRYPDEEVGVDYITIVDITDDNGDRVNIVSKHDELEE